MHGKDNPTEAEIRAMLAAAQAALDGKETADDGTELGKELEKELNVFSQAVVDTLDSVEEVLVQSILHHIITEHTLEIVCTMTVSAKGISIRGASRCINGEPGKEDTNGSHSVKH